MLDILTCLETNWIPEYVLDGLERADGVEHMRMSQHRLPPLSRALAAEFPTAKAPRQLSKLIVVAGPAGTGKSTIAQKLADTFVVPYIEGDNFHPSSNIRKMTSGTPLDPSDRALWLEQLWEEIGRKDFCAVVTCSALDLKTRTWLRHMAQEEGVGLHFAYLWASESTLAKRAQGRKGHYMKADMVHSQCAIMQVPGASEKADADAISTDVDGADAVFQLCLAALTSRQDLWM